MIFLTSWLAMLGIGAAHAHDARVPALGYLTVFWLVFALAIVIAGEAAVHSALRSA